MSNPINPFIWLDSQAADAADFYAAAFPGARLLGGSPLVVSVHVGGLKLSLLNGGPQFKVNPSISFFYNCDSEAEINALWEALSRGGILMPLDAYPFARKCGWLKDRFGVSWQVVPRVLEELMADPARSSRVVDAFLKMKKFDIAGLMRA